MKQARIASPQIIQGQPDSKVFQILDNWTSQIEIADKRALGDFHGKAAQRKTRYLSDLFQPLWKRPIVQFQWRNIQRKGNVIRPSCGAFGRKKKYFICQFIDKPGLFGYWNKSVRRYQTVNRMLPPRQDLKS